MRLSAVQSRITSKSCHRCCWPEATYNANTAECIYVTGAASVFLPFFSFFLSCVCVWKVQVHVWVEKTTAFRFGEVRQVAGLQGSEIKPIACSESRKWRRWQRRRRGGGEEEEEEEEQGLMEGVSGTQPSGLSGVREEKDNCLLSNLIPVEIPLFIFTI